MKNAWINVQKLESLKRNIGRTRKYVKPNEKMNGKSPRK